jgi:hypothetical protein
MRKLWLLVLVLLGIFVYSQCTHYGIVLGPFRLTLTPERLEVEVSMRRFLEDIQFKDFTHAATFHTAEDRKLRNIPQLIEDKFKIKPELMDIRDFEILRVEPMSTGQRAKVLTKVFVKVLNINEPVKEMDAVFFFKKQPDGKWYMDLQSSL